MKGRYSKRIVVDANIARGAGVLGDARVSAECRRALLAIRQYGHSVVMNANLRREWRTHASKFALSWLTAMQQQRRIVEMEEDSFAKIRKAIETRPADSLCRNAVLKDFHLIAAVLVHDRILVSHDSALKDCLAVFSDKHPELGSILWLAPSEADFELVLQTRAGYARKLRGERLQPWKQEK